MGRRAGPPRIYLPKGSTVYWCRFTSHGVRYRLRTGERDPRKAQDAAVRLKAKKDLGRQARVELGTRRAQGDLENLVVRYLESAKARGKAGRYVHSQLLHFRAQFLPRWQDLGDIDPETIAAWQRERLASGVSSSTRYKEEVSLRQFLRWCKKVDGSLDEVPHFDPTVPVSTYVPPDVSPSEVERWLALLPDRKTHPKRCPVREFYTVAYELALRHSDTCRLRWEQIDFRHGAVIIPKGSDKAKGEWILPLTDRARDILAVLQAEKKPEASHLIFGLRQFDVSLRKARAKAKIARGNSHAFRHSRLSDLGANTQDIVALREFARHKSMTQTDRYVRSRLPRLEALVDASEAAARKLAKRAQKKKRPSKKKDKNGRKKNPK